MEFAVTRLTLHWFATQPILHGFLRALGSAFYMAVYIAGYIDV